MEVRVFTSEKLEVSSYSTCKFHSEDNSSLHICSSSEEESETRNSPCRADFYLYELAHVATSPLMQENCEDAIPLLALTQVACSNLEEANAIKREGNIRIYSTKSNPNFLDVTPYLIM